MSDRLVVLAPRVGGASETFVRRHIENLIAPDDVHVVARERVPAATWEPAAPTTVLGGRDAIPHGSLMWRIARVGATRLRRHRVSGPPVGAKVAIEEVLRRGNTEALLAEYLDTWATLLPQLDANGVNLVVRAHGYDVSQRVRSPRWRDAFKRLSDVATIAAVSGYSRELLLRSGLPAERVITVPNGVDVVRFSPSVAAKEPGPFRVLSVGRLVAKKHPGTTLRAVAEIVKAGGPIAMTVIGDGPLRGEVEQLVAELGIAGHVELLGSRPHDDVVAALARADVFVQHSQTTPDGDEEGLPVGLLEAMAAGIAVIGTRHAGITEVLEPDAGLVVEPNDVAAMHAALHRLAVDPDERSALAARGRARVIGGYTWEHERGGLLAALGLSS